MDSNNKINMGIWLDKREAAIVSLSTQAPVLRRLYSQVESYHPSGGARSEAPWGPRDVVAENTYLNRKKQQLKVYYEAIIEKVKGANNLLIIGPGDAKKGLIKCIYQAKGLKFQNLKVQNSDKLTDNQLKALIASYFEKKST